MRKGLEKVLSIICPQQFLMAYKYTIIKFVVSFLILIGALLVANYYNISRNSANQIAYLCYLIAIISSMLVFGGSVCEFLSTYENKKLQKLKTINPYYIKSETTLKNEFFESLKSSRHVYIIIKNQKTVLKVGCDVVLKSSRDIKTGLHNIDHKFYYIDKIKGDHIERVEFRNFNVFEKNINHFNGYNDTFEVVSINKTNIPDTKEY